MEMTDDNKRIIRRYDKIISTTNECADNKAVIRFDDIPQRKLREMIEGSLIDSEEMIKRKIEHIPMIMTPFLRPGGLVLVYAYAGVGKTYFCMSLVTAITRNVPIGKWSVESPVGCVYVDGEMSYLDIVPRLQMLSKDLPDRKAPLVFLTSEEMDRKEKIIPDLTNKKWRDAISDMLRENQEYGLIVLDNVSSLAPNINENSKKDWDKINQWLLALRRMKKAVILVHHASIKGNPRGTTGRLDNVDFTIHLKKIDGGSEEEEASFRVEIEKKRSISIKAAEPFCMTIRTDEDSGLPWTTSNVIENRRPYIIALIGLGMKQRDIAEALKCTEPNVTQLKKKATKEGLFNEAGEPTAKWLEIYKGDTVEDIIKEFTEY